MGYVSIHAHLRFPSSIVPMMCFLKLLLLLTLCPADLRTANAARRDHRKVLDLPENIDEVNQKSKCKWVRNQHKAMVRKWHPDKAKGRFVFAALACAYTSICIFNMSKRVCGIETTLSCCCTFVILWSWHCWIEHVMLGDKKRAARKFEEVSEAKQFLWEQFRCSDMK